MWHSQFKIDRIPKYDWSSNEEQPEVVVVTSHKGHYYENVLLPLLRDEYGFKGEILSAASTAVGISPESDLFHWNGPSSPATPTPAI